MNDVLKTKEGNIYNPKIPRYERGNKYTTEEVKTGNFWIDGKPIYRMCTKDKRSGTQINKQNVLFTLPSNTDEIVDIRYTSIAGGLVYSQGTGDIAIFVNGTSKQITEQHTDSWWNNVRVSIVLEYTKTTD